MADLIFFDGFDYYTDVKQRWDYQHYRVENSQFTPPAISSTAGRHDSGLLLTNGGCVYKGLPDLSTVGIGFAFRITANPPASGRNILVLRDETNVQLYLTITSAMTMTINNGLNSILGTSSTIFTLNIWAYVEILVTVATSGSYTFRVNGTTDHTASGVRTKGNGEDRVNFVRFGSNAAGAYPTHFDDIYISRDALIGPVHMEAHAPNGGVAGKMTMGHSGAGSLYQALASQDSAYAQSLTGGIGDLAFSEFENTEESGAVHAVALHTLARKEYGNTRAIRNAIFPRTGGGATVYNGSIQYLTTENHFCSHIWNTNPSTGGTFDPSSYNGSRFGVERMQ